MQNAIGPAEFLFLRGHPEPPRRGALLIARPGVKGNAVWLDVKHGRPFKMRSMIDCYDLYEGRVIHNNYCELIGDNPMNLVWEGQSMSEEGFMVCVLDVRIVDLHAIAMPCGGFDDANNQARLECEWDLLPVLQTL